MSIGLGIAIGALYGVSAYVSHRIALRFSDHAFLGIMFGGMLLRMVLLLVLVTLSAWLLPLNLTVFAVALAGMLLLSLAAEVTLIQRRS